MKEKLVENITGRSGNARERNGKHSGAPSILASSDWQENGRDSARVKRRGQEGVPFVR